MIRHNRQPLGYLKYPHIHLTTLRFLYFLTNTS
nr:MAG TPA: hypothetical protein [Bacteriophage sp.]DAH37744.1 MAG TPA: hypothetical protein [Caudoviricetes sp.]